MGRASPIRIATKRALPQTVDRLVRRLTAFNIEPVAFVREYCADPRAAVYGDRQTWARVVDACLLLAEGRQLRKTKPLADVNGYRAVANAMDAWALNQIRTQGPCQTGELWLCRKSIRNAPRIIQRVAEMEWQRGRRAEEWVEIFARKTSTGKYRRLTCWGNVADEIISLAAEDHNKHMGQR